MPTPTTPFRVLILTHHYPPEVGAPQTRLSGTAAFLRSRGHDVRVVAALPSYPTGVIPPQYHGRGLVSAETIDGIRVYRTWTWARTGGSTRVRLLNQLSFTLSALAALPLVGKRDVVLVESPPLFLGLTGALFGLALRAPVVLHVSDLWPAVAIQLGALRNPTIIRAALLFERAVYRASRRLIVVTHAWRQELVARGVPPSRISLATNGVDTEVLDPSAAEDERARLRSAMSLEDTTVVACVGTVSNVYDYGLILEAARRLQGGNERFLLVGDGSQKAALEQEATRLGLQNVILLPAQPHERVRGLLAAADISVTALQPIPFTRGQLPVRVLEAMSMALPIVLAGEGEARTLVERAEAGLGVAPRDAETFVGALARLSSDPELRREMGANGRRTIEQCFSRGRVAARIEDALRLAAGRRHADAR